MQTVSYPCLKTLEITRNGIVVPDTLRSLSDANQLYGHLQGRDTAGGRWIDHLQKAWWCIWTRTCFEAAYLFIVQRQPAWCCRSCIPSNWFPLKRKRSILDLPMLQGLGKYMAFKRQDRDSHQLLEFFQLVISTILGPPLASRSVLQSRHTWCCSCSHEICKIICGQWYTPIGSCNAAVG